MKNHSDNSLGDPTIQRLDPIISNKIAAGEVVERPAAVVKELIENAVDAGATQLTVEIKDAGKSLIRVSDNGKGIADVDLLLAFERHATSKISSIEDIYRISTLGFRGEALASIASVSRVECITKTEHAVSGTRVMVNGGVLSTSESIGTNRGTTMIVRDLFYNTPVRYKFLKSNQAEQTAIVDLVNKLALSHPHIGVTLIVDDRELYRTEGRGKLLYGLLTIYGRAIVDHLIPIEAQADSYSLSGLIAKPSYTRGNRNYQMFFVNGRYVKSEAIQKTIFNCYKGLITIGQFPAYALHMTLPYDQVDVNIHPSKTEVRFNDVVAIEGFIFSAIKNRLLSVDLVPKAPTPIVDARHSHPASTPGVHTRHSHPSSTPVVDTRHSHPASTPAIHTRHSHPASTPGVHTRHPHPASTPGADSSDSLVADSILAFFESEAKVKIQEEQLEIRLEPIEKSTLYDDLRILGQLFNTYIVAERGTSAYLIDQHAAHERVLFEAFFSSFKEKRIESQMLLVPFIYAGDFAHLTIQEQAISWLETLGVSIDHFGDQDWVVRSVPIVSGEPMSQQAITVMLDAFQNYQRETLDEQFVEDVIRQSCKAAIKANHALTNREILALLSSLKSLENPYTCPHGRPIIIEMTDKEIEKRFKRT